MIFFSGRHESIRREESSTKKERSVSKEEYAGHASIGEGITLFVLLHINMDLFFERLSRLKCPISLHISKYYEILFAQ